MEIGTYPLEKTSIFQGADAQQVQKMLGVILPSIKTYARGETICRAGETVSSLGIVLAGGATIELCDAWGNRSIIERLEPGEVFAEAYACVPGSLMLQHVTAYEKSEILFINIQALLKTDGIKNEAQLKLLKNLLTVCASKNLKLSSRMLNITPKTIRARLMSYFSECIKTTGSYTFDIPYDRRQLADYLGTDRSALSAELSKMQKEGLLTYRKNHFEMFSGCQ